MTMSMNRMLINHNNRTKRSASLQSAFSMTEFEGQFHHHGNCTCTRKSRNTFLRSQRLLTIKPNDLLFMQPVLCTTFRSQLSRLGGASPAALADSWRSSCNFSLDQAACLLSRPPTSEQPVTTARLSITLVMLFGPGCFRHLQVPVTSRLVRFNFASRGTGSSSAACNSPILFC